MKVLLMLSLLLLVAVAPACKKKVATGKPDAGAAATQPLPVENVRPVAVHASGVTNKCVGGLDRSGAPQEFVIAGKKWRRQGYELTALDKDPDTNATLGLLSDIKDASEGTLANLKSFIARFKKRGVDAIIATGDIAEEAPDLRNVLITLADSGLPTFVIIGNIESLKDYDAAFAAVSAQKPNLFDLNKLRFVSGDDFDLVSLPGYHDANHVRTKEGCAYTAEDVNDVAKLVGRVTQAPVLVSHGPPRGTTNSSLDYLGEKEGHVGDEKLASLIQRTGIAFGVFGNVMEQGGTGVAADFNTRVAPGVFADRLYVNVGRASATPWNMNSGEVSTGMAMVLRIQNKKASYEVLKAGAKPTVPLKGAAPAAGSAAGSGSAASSGAEKGSVPAAGSAKPEAPRPAK